MSDNTNIVQAALNKSRKDKFQLILTIPNILKTINSKNVRENEFMNLDSLQFSVYGINIPTIQVPAVELHYSGQNYNVSSFDRPPYEPLTINFAVDNEFKNYWVIWKWLQLLNDAKESTYGAPNIFKTGHYPEQMPKTLYDYTTPITVFALDEYNKKKVEFKFSDCFPTKLGSYNYSYRDPEEIDCTFEFVFNQLDMSLV
jgi:hypothetical protein